MKFLLLTLFLTSFVYCGEPTDSVQASSISIRPVRLQESIKVDGVLSEDVWKNEFHVPELTQRDPLQGTKPTEHTVICVAYDEAALYIGARLYDSHPDSIVARLGRRDTPTNSDRFVFYIDPYFDRRSGFFFGLNAAGTLEDGILYNDDWDDASWDGVWEGKVSTDAEGWTVEMRIPYSQLRFHNAVEYTWGINFRRDIARKNESDFLVFTPKNGSGFVSRFASLAGIEKISASHQFEILPYLTTRAEYLQHAAKDPFNTGSRFLPATGVDVKYGLGSDLTLNATINPDFGQVEVDPAVVNLSDVETFFSEKRPFFIEGSSIFNFGQGGGRNFWGFNWPGPDFLYSRRIGRAPHGSLPDYDFADVPSGTHILGAAKLTGKVGNNWNIGTINAVTARELADVQLGGNGSRVEVEPLTYYGIARGLKEFDQGRQGVGVLSTVAVRKFEDDRLRDEMNSSGTAVGLDAWSFLDESKSWVVTGWLGATHIRGNQARMIAVQENSQHYFQRPDATEVSVDSAATSMTGYGSRVYLIKQKGNSFVNSAIGILSPKFDVNDVGFLSRADIINFHVGGGYNWPEMTGIFRTAEIGGAIFSNFDYAWNTTWQGIYVFGSNTFQNYYNINWDLAYNPWTTNNRRTRGGPLMLTPPGYQTDFSINSDSRNTWVYDVGEFTYYAGNSKTTNVYFDVQWRPASNVSLTIGPNINYDTEISQWVGAFDDPLATLTFGKRYVFAEMNQTTFSAAIRLNWTFSPTLSLQTYIQPLISAGDYHDFKELARPKSYDFNHYGEESSTFDAVNYIADPDGPGGPAPPISLGNPNFNIKSIRGNAVLRWEYLPGSTVYFVWTQSRSDVDNNGDFQFNRSMGQLFELSPDNIFMVKFAYWLSM